MRNITIIIIAILIILVNIAIIILDETKSNNNIKLDLPQEFNQVKQGDTLRVYKVTKDSVYIELYNKSNGKPKINLNQLHGFK